MKTLITALAVTATLTASAVAKTQRTREIHNAVSRNHGNQINLYCRFEHGESDPDHRIRLQLVRDCKIYEDDAE